MYPNRCPHGSVYVRGTQCYLQEAGNNNAQSIASMLNEKWLQIQKISLNLVWLTLEQEQKLVLPLCRLPLKKRDRFCKVVQKTSNYKKLHRDKFVMKKNHISQNIL